MINCSSVIIMFLILVMVYMITTSKKNNICFLLSLSVGIVFSWGFYFLISELIDLSSVAIKFGNLLARFKSLPTEQEKIVSFVYGFWMIFVFIAFFIITEFISVRFLVKDNYFGKRSKGYYFIKTITIFFNFILSAYAIIFAVSDLNIIYNMPKSFLYFIIEIATEGIYLL